MFSLLAINEVASATELAEQSGNFRVAFMMSQASGDEEVKFLLKKQLTKWIEDGSIRHIPGSVQNIYRVLCGEVLHSDFGVSLLSELDWTQALGMLFWYCNKCDAGLSDSVDDFVHYENALPKPLVKYHHPEGIGRDYDALYYLLLAIFKDSNLIDSLSPRGYSADPLDYQVFLRHLKAENRS
jgi:hypothetical protein